MQAYIKFILAAVLFSLMPAGVLLGLEVDVEEISRTKKIEFINYRGPARSGDTDSVREIRTIGSRLAQGVKRSGPNRRIPYLMKYSVIHAISEKEAGKYSADIISIDRAARVDHIKNIRRILSGFYQSMYDYSRKNADTLALFTTYYNAVHRGDMAYFREKYKTVVLGRLNEKNAGISTKYYEWPGATMLVIPLTEEAMRGKLNSIDTDIISDKKVIEQVRKDKGAIDERKDMVDMREKIQNQDKEELAREKDRLKDEKDRLSREKETLQREKDQLDRQKEQTRKKEETIQREKEQTNRIKDEKEREEKQQKVRDKEKDLSREKERDKKQEDTLRKKEETIDRKEQTLERQREKAEEKEQKLERKDNAIREEKEQIRKDEKNDTRPEEKLAKKEKELEQKEKELDTREDKLRNKELDKSIYADKLYYLKIREYLEGGHYNNELYMINAATKRIDFKSPVENICGRRYDVYSEGVVVITHKGSHTEGHHLNLIDRKTLVSKVQGSDNIFWRSFVEIREGYVYAILKENDSYYLGKFDNTLKRVAKSGEKINENTFISFYDPYIYINRFDKQIIVLKNEDLSLIDIVNK